jgi:Spx/MgsR family transcriptional regulator
MVIQVYVYSSCSSCRKTVEALEALGVDFRVRDYLKHRFTADELSGVLTDAGLTPAMALSTRSRVYRERELDAEVMSDDHILNLMVEEPTLIRRPIIIKGSAVVIGHNPAKLATLVAS